MSDDTFDVDDNEIIQPASIPELVLKRKESTMLYLIAVIAIALVAIVPIVGAIMLAFSDRQIPGEIWLAVGSSVSALGFMLGYNSASK